MDPLDGSIVQVAIILCTDRSIPVLALQVPSPPPLALGARGARGACTAGETTRNTQRSNEVRGTGPQETRNGRGDSAPAPSSPLGSLPLSSTFFSFLGNDGRCWADGNERRINITFISALVLSTFPSHEESTIDQCTEVRGGTTSYSNAFNVLRNMNVHPSPLPLPCCYYKCLSRPHASKEPAARKKQFPTAHKSIDAITPHKQTLHLIIRSRQFNTDRISGSLSFHSSSFCFSFPFFSFFFFFFLLFSLIRVCIRFIWT